MIFKVISYLILLLSRVLSSLKSSQKKQRLKYFAKPPTPPNPVILSI